MKEMYKWYTVLILLSVLNFTACNTENTTHKNDLIEQNLNGNVKSLKKITYTEVDEFGNVIKGENILTNKYYTFNREGYKTNEIWYDSRGKMVKKNTFDYDDNFRMMENKYYGINETLETKILFTYDDSGKEIERKILVTEGNQVFKGVVNYDTNGNIIEGAIYKSDGSIENKFIFNHDKRGNIIEEIFFKFDGSIEGKSTFKFDDMGRIIEHNTFNTDGTLNNKTISKYDDNGNEVEFKMFSPDGTIFNETTTIYELFDINNNWIKSIDYKYGVPNYLNERIIEYFE